jgi:multidrug efflux system membrane fusion protein
LTVATTVVQQGPQGPYVYVIKPDNTVELRSVTVGQTGARRVIITNGLKPGEQVVTNGQSRLQPGARAAVVSGEAAQQLASQSGSGMVIP